MRLTNAKSEAAAPLRKFLDTLLGNLKEAEFKVMFCERRRPIRAGKPLRLSKLYTHKQGEIALYEATAYLQKRLGLTPGEIGRVVRIDEKRVLKWLRDGRVPLSRPHVSAAAKNIIHLVVIHKCMERIFGKPESQQEWLRSFRPDLKCVPIEKISESLQALVEMRVYLESVAENGW